MMRSVLYLRLSGVVLASLAYACANDAAAPDSTPGAGTAASGGIPTGGMPGAVGIGGVGGQAAGAGGFVGMAGAAAGAAGLAGIPGMAGSVGMAGMPGMAGSIGVAGMPGVGGFGGVMPPVAGGAGPVPQGLLAVPAQQSVGIEWQLVPGATGYNVYWSTSPGVQPGTGMKIANAQRNHLHTRLNDGTPYYYVVTAIVGGVESAPSMEVSATPGGAFRLEHFGNGDAVGLMGPGTPLWVPIERRIHILVLGDGYLRRELDTFNQDVADYMRLVFDIPLYAELRESMLFWSMPKASQTHISGGNTAFGLTSQPRPGNDTPRLIWEAVKMLPYPPTRFYTGGSGRARNHVVSMMAYRESSGKSGYSGFARGATDPATGRAISVGYFHDRQHELSHALGDVRDEYYELDHDPWTSTREDSNISGTTRCNDLPWKHLLFGGQHNPGVDQLVGAFGRDRSMQRPITGGRYHSEFKCQLNGSHENRDVYGGRGWLRVQRFCNWCRELITYRVYERMGLLGEDDRMTWPMWKVGWRDGFYQVFQFKTPMPVPQTNSNGRAWFEACVP